MQQSHGLFAIATLLVLHPAPSRSHVPIPTSISVPEHHVHSHCREIPTGKLGSGIPVPAADLYDDEDDLL